MATTADDVKAAPELGPLGLKDIPDGPGAAAFLAAGIGVFFLGFLTVLNEMIDGLHDFFGTMGGGVGPLAGKTTFAVVAYVVSWIVLHFMWKDKDVDMKKTFKIAVVLGILGALGTFPPVFLIWH